MWTLITLFLVITVVIVFRFINMKKKPAIIGVYQQENKYFWIKYRVMFVLLNISKLFEHIRRQWAVEKGISGDGNIHVHNDDVELEKVQPLGELPMSADGVYFNGTSKTGSSIVCSVMRRQNGCDAFLMLKVEDQELLLTPSLPNTSSEENGEGDSGYKAAGLTIKNVVPMRVWTIDYDGVMKTKTDSEKTVPVKISLTWSTAFSPFNYKDISSYTLAADVAREDWTKEFFANLKRFKQDHYEQCGDLLGTANIDGREYALNIPCFRDHSFAKQRNLRNLHRYVYHFIYLDNGDYIAVGSASQPVTISHLTIGYYCRKSDHQVHPIDASTFHLFNFGEHQILPANYGFIFTCEGNTYAVQVLANENQEQVYYLGEGNQVKLYERWCRYEVNGASGWGTSEWLYNNERKS